MPTIDKSIGAFHDSSNARIRKIGGYTGPNPYVTGGDPISPANLGMSRIELILFANAINTDVTPLYAYPVWTPDAAGGGKVRWVTATTGIEVGNGSNLSNYFCRFEAIGK